MLLEPGAEDSWFKEQLRCFVVHTYALFTLFYSISSSEFNRIELKFLAYVQQTCLALKIGIYESEL